MYGLWGRRSVLQRQLQLTLKSAKMTEELIAYSANEWRGHCIFFNTYKGTIWYFQYFGKECKDFNQTATKKRKIQGRENHI